MKDVVKNGIATVKLTKFNRGVVRQAHATMSEEKTRERGVTTLEVRAECPNTNAIEIPAGINL